MIRVRSSLMGIDQGELLLFSDFESGGAMWTGSGPRECRRVVHFSEPFQTEPAVHVYVAMLDLDNGTSTRFDLKAENVRIDRFDIVFRTWADTKVARARASWMATGELRHSDDWIV